MTGEGGRGLHVEVGRGLDVEVGRAGSEAMRGKRRGRKAIFAALVASIQVSR